MGNLVSKILIKTLLSYTRNEIYDRLNLITNGNAVKNISSILIGLDNGELHKLINFEEDLSIKRNIKTGYLIKNDQYFNSKK
jgi:hypothetical protein